jgi:type II secretory pathway pseudopilin PulG
MSKKKIADNHTLFNKRGFTFLGVLAFLVVAGIALTAASKYWSTVIKREKEEELLFRGDQIKSAITSYYDNTPKGRRPSYPKSLEDLLKDPRFLTVRRHLRKVYKDPITEDGAWGLIKDSKGGIKGVFSRSNIKPIKTGNFSKAYEDFEKAKTYSDWRFLHTKEKQKKPASKSG